MHLCKRKQKMHLIHTEVIPEQLKQVLVECHENAMLQTSFPYTNSVSRKFRCKEIDVKVHLNLMIQYDFSESSEAGQPHTFQLLTKWALSLDCVNLRHNRSFFFGDTEYISVLTEIPCAQMNTDTEEVYDILAKHLASRLDEFKVCFCCRVLYLDKRTKEAREMQCLQCLFDRAFFTADTTCVICKDIVQRGEQTYTLTCGHAYHAPCILSNFVISKKRECPLCRETDST